MLWDNHMHSFFSGDSKTPPINMIKEARQKGLPGITFTDHLDYDYCEDEKDLFLLDFDKYIPEMKQLASENTDSKFTVLTGIEIGLQSHIAEKNHAVMNNYNFDYIIGSIHLVNGQDPYYKEFWKGRSVEKTVERYYETILENIRLTPDFDALGHMDYIFRYCMDRPTMDTYYNYSDIIDAILQEIIRLDIALEINTGSYRNGLMQPNPSPVIMRRYRELGGKLITIGSDAHKPENIADHFDEIEDILKECGFSEYAVFRNRIPEMHGI